MTYFNEKYCNEKLDKYTLLVYHVSMTRNDINDVKLSRLTLRQLKKVPIYIALKLEAWIDDVGTRGLSEVKKIPGYHDEPLKGKRAGQRSIRLNKAYRAIYELKKGNILFVEVLEVNKHEY